VTLLDIKNHLYAHFLVKSTFSLKEDLGEIRLGAAYDDAAKGGVLVGQKEPLFRAALGDMERAGLILCLDQVAGLYVLTQPLTSLPQSVLVAPLTAHLVAELINGMGERTGFLNGGGQYVTNKFAITDGDILAIVQICHALSDEVDELYEMLDDGPPPDEDKSDGGGYNKLTHPFDPDTN